MQIEHDRPAAIPRGVGSCTSELFAMSSIAGRAVIMPEHVATGNYSYGYIAKHKTSNATKTECDPATAISRRILQNSEFRSLLNSVTCNVKTSVCRPVSRHTSR